MVTAVVYKPLSMQLNSHKGDVRVVHRLEFDAFLGALKVCICDELLDSCIEYGVVVSTEQVKQR